MLFLGEDFPDPGEDVDPDTVGQVGGAVTQLGEGGQVRNGLCKRQTDRMIITTKQVTMVFLFETLLIRSFLIR